MKHKIQKVVISMGLANRNVTQIQRVATHFKKIFEPYLLDKSDKVQQMMRTQCKVANSKFKIRKGTPAGLKITLRKHKIAKILELLQNRLNYSENGTFNNSSFFIGVKDHRMLKLQRYNYEAPEYGFNVSVVYSPFCNRLRTRRINPIYKKCTISEEEAKYLFEQKLKN